MELTKQQKAQCQKIAEEIIDSLYYGLTDNISEITNTDSIDEMIALESEVLKHLKKEFTKGK